MVLALRAFRVHESWQQKTGNYLHGTSMQVHMALSPTTQSANFSTDHFSCESCWSRVILPHHVCATDSSPLTCGFVSAACHHDVCCGGPRARASLSRQGARRTAVQQSIGQRQSRFTRVLDNLVAVLP